MSRLPQDGQTARDGPMMAQDRPKTAQDDPKTAEDGRKMAQDGFHTAQDGPNSSKMPRDGFFAASRFILLARVANQSSYSLFV